MLGTLLWILILLLKIYLWGVGITFGLFFVIAFIILVAECKSKIKSRGDGFAEFTFWGFRILPTNKARALFVYWVMGLSGAFIFGICFCWLWPPLLWGVAYDFIFYRNLPQIS